MLCTEFSLVKDFGQFREIQPLRCRCWHCDYCRPYRARLLKKEVMRGLPNTFLTLTANPSWGDSPDARAQALTRAWVEIRRRAKRKYGYKQIPFFAVFESTKRGEPHLHICLRVKWLDQQWLSDQMRDIMDSPIVDIRRVDNKARAAAYVGKYVGKGPKCFAGCKRYWKSQNYCAQPDPKDATGHEVGVSFYVVAGTPAELIDRYTSGGFYKVEEETRHGAVLSFQGYEGHRRYYANITAEEMERIHGCDPPF